jgi:phage tail P2-like protein
LLGVLAWDWHVDEYDAAETDAQRRALIAASWELHQYKGTPWAVLESLRAIGYPDVRLTEWFDAAPRRQPGTFELVFPPLQELQNPASWQRIHQVVRGYKNTRSWYTVAVALQPPVDDNTVDPPIPLTCAAGAAAVVIGHVPAGPIALHAAIRATQRAAAGPIIARPSGPATLPPAAGRPGQRGAGLVLVHVDSKPAEHWQTWAPHSLPRLAGVAPLQIAAGPVLASVVDGGAVLPASRGATRQCMTGMLIVHVGSLPADAWQGWWYDTIPADPTDSEIDDFIRAFRLGYETGFAPAWQTPDLTSDQAIAMWFDAIRQHDANNQSTQ